MWRRIPRQLIVPVMLRRAGVELPFEDDFAREDGDLGNDWEYSEGIWTIGSEKAIGTPTQGDDLVTNGDFAADSDWIKGAGWSIAGGVAVRDGTVGQTAVVQGGLLTIGQWYQIDWDIVTHNSGGGFTVTLGQLASYKTAPGSYAYANRSTNADVTLRGNAENGEADNVVARQITLVDLFATRDLEVSDLDIRVGVTCDVDSCVGMVICLDDKDTPANFLLCYISRNGGGNKITLDKCVDGVYTNLLSGAMSGDTTYVPGKILRLVKVGESIDVYYNGFQSGTTLKVSDAGVIGNTRHGLFADKGGANSLDDFFCDEPAS